MSSFLLTINEDPGKYFFFQVIGWGLLWFGCGSSPKDSCVESLVSSRASVSAIIAIICYPYQKVRQHTLWCYSPSRLAHHGHVGGGARGSGPTFEQWVKVSRLLGHHPRKSGVLPQSSRRGWYKNERAGGVAQRQSVCLTCTRRETLSGFPANVCSLPFTHASNMLPSTQTWPSQVDPHQSQITEAADLGLPSSKLWAQQPLFLWEAPALYVSLEITRWTNRGT